MAKLWKCLRCTPILVFVGVPLCIFTTYGLALVHHHVTPLLPYVSDTGALPPESCIFTFFFSTLSFILICASYVKYREVLELVRLKPTINIKPACNVAAFSLAIFSAVGLNIVASFQETNMFLIHLLGALMCFFGGTGYFVFQTIFTGRIYSKKKPIFYIRCILTVVNILCTVATFAPLHFALEQFEGNNVMKWTAEDGGYGFHLLSTFSEWLLVFSFASYMCSLFWDFRKFDMQPPIITFKNLDAALDQTEAQPSLNSVTVTNNRKGSEK